MKPIRNSEGKFVSFNSPTEYGGVLKCQRCGEEKPCTEENYRVINRGASQSISKVCRVCKNIEGRLRHENRKTDPAYILSRKQAQDKHRAANRDKQLLRNYQYIDKKKGQTCDLTIEILRHMIANPCYYCGGTEKIGLDRRDNTKPHSMINVIPCCAVCNVVRGDYFTVEDMKNILGPAIRNIREANHHD